MNSICYPISARRGRYRVVGRSAADNSAKKNRPSVVGRSAADDAVE
jgi:hypothetical protein